MLLVIEDVNFLIHSFSSTSGHDFTFVCSALLLLIVSTSAVACGGGIIGVKQDRDEDASTMAQSVNLHWDRVEY